MWNDITQLPKSTAQDCDAATIVRETVRKRGSISHDMK
jgi:hypothetical protein